MEDNRLWIFPKHVNMEDVCVYMDRLNSITGDVAITFDLQNTTRMHSSFVGFLIHAKDHVTKNGGRMTLLLSLTIEKILIMLNVYDYFATEIKPSVKKSA